MSHGGTIFRNDVGNQPNLTLHLTISLWVIGGGLGLLRPQEPTHLQNEIAPKIFSLISMQQIGCSELLHPILHFHSDYLFGLGWQKWWCDSVCSKQVVTTKRCFALVRTSKITVPKLLVATVLNRILTSNETNPTALFLPPVLRAAQVRQHWTFLSASVSSSSFTRIAVVSLLVSFRWFETNAVDYGFH